MAPVVILHGIIADSQEVEVVFRFLFIFFNYSISYIFSPPPVVKTLKYAESHEWAKVDGNLATIGITDHAQDHLGDVVYVELPDVGVAVAQGNSFGAVESVKATSDINSPVSGKVIEVNEELNSSPGLVSTEHTCSSSNVLRHNSLSCINFVVHDDQYLV